jgi:hypothetical protein
VPRTVPLASSEIAFTFKGITARQGCRAANQAIVTAVSAAGTGEVLEHAFANGQQLSEVWVCLA